MISETLVPMTTLSLVTSSRSKTHSEIWMTQSPPHNAVSGTLTALTSRVWSTLVINSDKSSGTLTLQAYSSSESNLPQIVKVRPWRDQRPPVP